MADLFRQILEWFKPNGKKQGGRPLKRRRRPAYLRKSKRRRQGSGSGNEWIPYAGSVGLSDGNGFGGGSSAGGGASGEW